MCEFANVNSFGCLTSTGWEKCKEESFKFLFVNKIFTLVFIMREFPHDRVYCKLLVLDQDECLCLLPFCLERKGMIKHRIVMCDEMEWLYALQSAVALRDTVCCRL